MITLSKDELKKIKETEKSSNHYCIVTAFPKLHTDTSVFVFKNGNKWSEEDMYHFIAYMFNSQPHHKLLIDEIKYRVPYEECYVLAKSMREEKGEYIDWIDAGQSITKFGVDKV